MSPTAAVYRAIVENSLLKNRQLEAYRIIYANGPVTASEISKLLGECGIIRPRDSISPRLAELARFGAIRRAGTRHCTVTGEKTWTWEVTGALPQRRDRKPSRRFWVVGPEAFTDEASAITEAARLNAEIIPVAEVRRGR